MAHLVAPLESTSDALLVCRAVDDPDRRGELVARFGEDAVDAVVRNALTWADCGIEGRPLGAVALSMRAAEVGPLFIEDVDSTGAIPLETLDDPTFKEISLCDLPDTSARVASERPRPFSVKESEVVVAAVHRMAVSAYRRHKRGEVRAVVEFLRRNSPNLVERALCRIAFRPMVALSRRFS